MRGVAWKPSVRGVVWIDATRYRKNINTTHMKSKTHAPGSSMTSCEVHLELSYLEANGKTGNTYVIAYKQKHTLPNTLRYVNHGIYGPLQPCTQQMFTFNRAENDLREKHIHLCNMPHQSTLGKHLTIWISVQQNELRTIR